MRNKIISIILAGVVCSQISGAAKEAVTINVVPYPQKVELTGGTFKVKGAPVNCDTAFEPEIKGLVRNFAATLSLCTNKKSSYGEPVGLKGSWKNGSLKGIVFVRNTSLALEEYSIEISKKALVVEGCTYNAILYGIQTLKQILPTEIYTRTTNEKADWTLPCLKIQDRPRFTYRGMHMDPSRHFWSVEETKKYLDVMAMYKINRFHWHLTDDQGWRIEIKKYPELTQVGAYRRGTMIGKDKNSCDNVRYGGYYTQDQIREVVEYAAKLGITIIPEIDLPGHMQAALATYPELGCGTGPYEVWTRWGVSKQVLNPGKEEVMTFLEDVLTEVAGLFPGEYFHIGGDECPRDEWKTCPEVQALIARLGFKAEENVTPEDKVQNYVMTRMQNHLAGLGKKIIGWDEILEGDVAPGATIMSWRGKNGGIKASQRGFDVIMAPNDYCYLDYYQSKDHDNEPLAIGGFVPLEKTYSLEPQEGLDAEAASHIIGVQANLWTEYIATEDHLEYMLLPRMLALSEVQWCRPEVKDFTRFEASVKGHQFEILDALGYNHHK